jgi:hypothetical protein
MLSVIILLHFELHKAISSPTESSTEQFHVTVIYTTDLYLEGTWCEFSLGYLLYVPSTQFLYKSNKFILFSLATCLAHLGHLQIGDSTLTHYFFCSYSPTLASVYSYYSINVSCSSYTSLKYVRLKLILS